MAKENNALLLETYICASVRDIIDWFIKYTGLSTCVFCCVLFSQTIDFA